jgi:hypothetical protein
LAVLPIQPVSYFVHASTAPLAQYSTVWRSRETGVDSRESIVDARYQTIRVPGLLAGLVIRHGIDDISVRCSILRLYESCRTSSAFCVEFEFQKLLRHGPEVLGEGRGGEGMAWQLLLHRFLTRERTRWRTGLHGPFSKFNRGLALFCSSAAELGELGGAAPRSQSRHISKSVRCPSYHILSYVNFNVL